MTRRHRLALALVALAVIVVLSPLPDPLALVTAAGSVAMWGIYSTPKEKP